VYYLCADAVLGFTQSADHAALFGFSVLTHAPRRIDPNMVNVKRRHLRRTL